jgi:choline dehydrogenase-like flavoprotein
MSYSNKVRKESLKSIADVSHIPFWLDDPARPAAEPALSRDLATDLLVIGAGFTGLWTALLAKEEDPGREVTILEAGKSQWLERSNGGFMDSSITRTSEWTEALAPGVSNIARVGDCEPRRNQSTIKHWHRMRLSHGDIGTASEPYQVEG